MKIIRLPFSPLKPVLLLAGIGLGFFLSSCEMEQVDPAGQEVSNNLHFSFVTPDWEKNIDCTHLDLPSFGLDEETYYTFATSQSTRSTFYISYPADSSEIVKPGNLKKYAVKEVGMNDGPFQFSLVLPMNEGSKQRLISQEGFSDISYNEIISIEYIGQAENEAVFKIKGRYSMITADLEDADIQKEVSGTYHFKIRTSRD